MMDEERSLSDVLWDYGVYVPIGLAATLVEELGRLTEKGKQRAGGQVHTAQVLGKLAVGEGRRQFAKLFGDTSASDGDHQETASSRGASGRSKASPRGAAPAAGETDKGPEAGGASRRQASRARPAPAESGPAVEGDGRPSAVPSSTTPDAGSLAIPAYDTLAASQVVQRLSSLRPEELEAVRRYELATRGRRTILHRIAQLTTDA